MERIEFIKKAFLILLILPFLNTGCKSSSEEDFPNYVDVKKLRIFAREEVSTSFLNNVGEAYKEMFNDNSDVDSTMRSHYLSISEDEYVYQRVGVNGMANNSNIDSFEPPEPYRDNATDYIWEKGRWTDGQIGEVVEHLLHTVTNVIFYLAYPNDWDYNDSYSAISLAMQEAIDKGIYDVKSCSMGKLIVTELHEKISTQCLQFFGGNGYTEDYPMARMLRDSRIGTIGGGTSEIMRDIIAKVVIDDVKYKKAKSNVKPNESLINTESNFLNHNKNSFLEKSDKHDLAVAIKSIEIAENTLNITIKHINQSDINGVKKSSSQVIRHQIAQMASEIECYKQFVYSIYNSIEITENIEKEIAMAKLTAMQLMDKVVSECFEMFGFYDSLEHHPLEKISQNSKMIQISNNKRDLHDNISKLIIEQKL